MTKDDCFELGHITKTHGINGELVFFLDVDAPADYEDLDTVLIDVKGDLIPYFIESISINKNRAIVALEDVETVEQAERLIKCGLFLPLDNLEPIQDPDRFYYHEIPGFRVVDAAAGGLGTVTTVYAMPTQDLIAMQYQGQEILIPINSAIVQGVDRDKKQLNVTLPDGLLDVYLSDAANQKPEGEVDDIEDADDDHAN